MNFDKLFFDELSNTVRGLFDSATLNFLGVIPKTNKQAYYNSAKNNLTSLFFQSLGSRQPNRKEETALKMIMISANEYLNALKEKTNSEIISSVINHIQDSNLKGETIKPQELKSIINDGLNRGKERLEDILETESHRTVNTGTALQIARVGESQGSDDPIVFFNVVMDDRTGDEEKILHLLPDGLTPRCWKLSELGGGYHKKGDPTPKVAGLHPNCRCTINYLPRGYSFNSSGKLEYKEKGWDELSHQREVYGFPR